MATRTRELPRSQWRDYFDRLSKRAKTARVRVLIQKSDLGVQEQVEGTQLEGMTYDSGDDALELAMTGTVHRIGSPREIYVQEDASGELVSCQITDNDGYEQIIQLEPARTLPASA